MTNDQKADALTRLAEAAGLQVEPEYVPGLVGNYGNFEALHRRVMEGFASELPLDPLGSYRP